MSQDYYKIWLMAEFIPIHALVQGQVLGVSTCRLCSSHSCSRKQHTSCPRAVLLIQHCTSCMSDITYTSNSTCSVVLTIRTGRIDRKIEFPLPGEKTRRRIFQIHTKKMTLAADLDLEEYITAKDDLSGADIKVHFYRHCMALCIIHLRPE